LLGRLSRTNGSNRWYSPATMAVGQSACDRRFFPLRRSLEGELMTSPTAGRQRTQGRIRFFFPLLPRAQREQRRRSRAGGLANARRRAPTVGRTGPPAPCGRGKHATGSRPVRPKPKRGTRRTGGWFRGDDRHPMPARAVDVEVRSKRGFACGAQTSVAVAIRRAGKTSAPRAPQIGASAVTMIKHLWPRGQPIFDQIHYVQRPRTGRWISRERY